MDANQIRQILEMLDKVVSNQSGIMANLYNPWLGVLTQTTTDKECIKLKEDLLVSLTMPEGGVCMVTQQQGTVGLAHILPRSTKYEVKKLLGITNINDFRNLLLLSKGIEVAFDQMKVIFIPGNVMIENELRKVFLLKVLDVSCLNNWLYPSNSSGGTIGDLFRDNSIPYLHLTYKDKTHTVYKRCLAYHAMFAHFDKYGRYGEMNALGDGSSMDCEITTKLSNDFFIKYFRSERNAEEEEVD